MMRMFIVFCLALAVAGVAFLGVDHPSNLAMLAENNASMLFIEQSIRGEEEADQDISSSSLRAEVEVDDNNQKRKDGIII